MSESEEPHLLFERVGHVAVATLNRPAKKNALSSEPWTFEASGPSRNATGPAISDASASRPSGMGRRSTYLPSSSSSFVAWSSGVRTGPGATRFSRTPASPQTCARERPARARASLVMA